MNTYHHQHRRPLPFTTTLLLLLFFLSTLLLNYHPISADTTYDDTTTTGSDYNNTEFIRTSCNTTLYPETCYSSLSGYAAAVQQDPARLAKLAISISLANAHYLEGYFSNLSRQADYNEDHRAAAAVHDCYSNLGDAVDEMRDSLKQMRQIGEEGTTSTSSFRFMMSNVQTWMSAALSDEDTCTDGFEDVTDDAMKRDVRDRIVEVKMLTSNALALVNRYTNGS